MKRRLIFGWVFPGIYLATILIYLLGIIGGAGHTPRGFDFLFYVISAPCYLFDLLLPRGWINNLFLGFLICVAFGILACALVGVLLDIALRNYRQRRANE